MFDECPFSAPVSGVHGSNLGDGHVRFVDEKEVILREEFVQRIGCFAFLSSGEMAAIVFDSWAVADVLQHLDVESSPGIESLGFQQFSAIAKPFEPFLQFFLNQFDSALDPFFGSDEVASRINEDLFLGCKYIAGQRMDNRNLLDVVSPKLDPIGKFFVRWPNLDAVSADSEP